MPDNQSPRSIPAKADEASTEPPVTRSDTDSTDNSASTLIEAPVQAGRKKSPLDQHEFADGGGGGGAEAFRRKK